MKVGDLVSVERTHGREPVVGLVVEIKEDELNLVAVVESVKGGYQIYANPLDVKVINESR